MRRRVLATALVALWVSGCAVSPPPATEARHWSGRMALSVASEPPQHFQAGFELMGNAQTGQLRLHSPLGQLLAVAHWTGEQARLERGRDTWLYPDMRTLTESLTGTALPMEPLFAWLQGEPAALEGWEADLSRHADRRIVARRLQPTPAVTLRLVLE
jgi:outer membrane lipoprotein LolB